MIRRLTIRNFKCFSDESISFRKLTVLCGPNAGGKSTIIQAILLHRLAQQSRGADIRLNGPFGLFLGDADSLVSRSDTAENTSDMMEVGLLVEGIEEPCSYAFAPSSSPRSLKPIRREHTKGDSEPTSLCYLSAERIGPRLLQDKYSDSENLSTDVGFSGQFTAEVLEQYERHHVRIRQVDSSPDAERSLLLRGSVETWMSKVFGPIEVQVRPNNNAPPSIYFKRPGIHDEWTIASNTGFGLSYALPIIVAGLLAPENSILIVDSPEAHLHPAAQTAIAKFLCEIAASGVNVIVETHSDYILDGIRIAVTSPNERALDHDSCMFVTLGVDHSGNRELSQVKLRADGKPDKWPKGFFDQQLANLRAITDNVSGAREK